MDLWSGHGKSLRRNLVETLVVSLVLGTLIAAGVVWAGRADAACATPGGDPCPTWAHRQSVRFKHHRIGQSKGVQFTPKLKRQIRAAVAKQGRVAARDGSWWQWPFETTMCLTGVHSRTDCMSKTESAADMRRVSRQTTRIVVTCSGAAVIGSLRGGGWWGAGKGAGACLWSSYALWRWG